MPAAVERVDDVERRGRRVDLHRQRLPAALERSRAPRRAARRCRASAQPWRPRGTRADARRRAGAAIAAIGATMIRSSEPIAPSGLSSSSPKMPMKKKMFPIAEIAPAIIAAIDETRMSRFLMCANSCARTPRTWSRGRYWSRPCVTATAACSGLRPVANAFGCSDGISVDPRLRHVVQLRELRDELVQVGRLRLGDLLRARRPGSRTCPTSSTRRRSSTTEKTTKNQRAAPPIAGSDPDEQRGQAGEQDPGTGLRAEACSSDVHGDSFRLTRKRLCQPKVSPATVWPAVAGVPGSRDRSDEQRPFGDSAPRQRSEYQRRPAATGPRGSRPPRTTTSSPAQLPDGRASHALAGLPEPAQLLRRRSSRAGRRSRRRSSPSPRRTRAGGRAAARGRARSRRPRRSRRARR